MTLDLERWLADTDDVVARALGKEDLRGPALAHAVQNLSSVYRQRESSLANDARGVQGSLAARVRFFSPRDMLKIEGPIAELARVGRFPTRRPLRVLDLGCGPGTATLGLALTLQAMGLDSEISALGVDLDTAALGLGEELASTLRGLDYSTQRADLLRFDPRTHGRFDLISIAFALNELSEAAATTLAIQCLEALEENGSLVIWSPALRVTTQRLQRLRDVLVGLGHHVVAPCPPIEGCPMLQNPRDWCHTDLGDELPPSLADVARQAGLRAHRLTYSYLVVMSAPPTGNETDLLRVVSGPLKSKGKLERLVCRHSGLTRLRLLDRDVDDHNEALALARRGDSLRCEQAIENRVRDQTLEHIAHRDFSADE